MRWFWWVLIALAIAGAVATVVILAVIYTGKDSDTTSSGANTATLKVQFISYGDKADANKRLLGGDLERESIVLEKLEYYLLSIDLAETLDFNDNGGWTQPTNVLQLMPRDQDVDYDAYDYEKALADTDESHYVDVMDPVALREKLTISRPLTELFFGTATAGVEFYYVMINWMRPIRFQATGYNPDGDAILYTKKGKSHKEECDTDGPEAFCKFVTRAETPLHTGSSEKTVVLMNNGGTMVRLATPVKYDDLQREPHTLYIIMDPYQSLRANPEPRTSTRVSEMGSLMDDDGRLFELGMTTMVAVLLPEGGSIIREQYRIHMTDAVSWDALLQLYFVGDELRAANMGSMPKEGEVDLAEDAPLGGFLIVYMDYDEASMEYTFSGPDKDLSLVSKFKRGTNTTCHVRCLYLMCGDEMVMQDQDLTLEREVSLIGDPTDLVL